MLTRILEEFSELFADFVYPNFNTYLDSGKLPEKVKFAETVPTYKKKDKKDKNSYRPVSILSNVSKVYERCMQEQIND